MVYRGTCWWITGLNLSEYLLSCVVPSLERFVWRLPCSMSKLLVRRKDLIRRISPDHYTARKSISGTETFMWVADASVWHPDARSMICFAFKPGAVARSPGPVTFIAAMTVPTNITATTSPQVPQAQLPHHEGTMQQDDDKLMKKAKHRKKAPHDKKICKTTHTITLDSTCTLMLYWWSLSYAVQSTT